MKQHDFMFLFCKTGFPDHQHMIAGLTHKETRVKLFLGSSNFRLLTLLLLLHLKSLSIKALTLCKMNITRVNVKTFAIFKNTASLPP